MLVPIIYYIILYFGFINYLWGGILDPQLPSSFLLLDFGSMNSLWGGIPQKFPFNFSSCVHCLPKWTKSMSNSPRVSEQSLFLSTHVPVPPRQHVSPRLPSSPGAPPPPQHGRPRVRPPADEGRTPALAQGRQAAGNLLQAVALVAGAQGQVGLHEKTSVYCFKANNYSKARTVICNFTHSAYMCLCVVYAYGKTYSASACVIRRQSSPA